jgi:hypothetical protein
MHATNVAWVVTIGFWAYVCLYATIAGSILNKGPDAIYRPTLVSHVLFYSQIYSNDRLSSYGVGWVSIILSTGSLDSMFGTGSHCFVRCWHTSPCFSGGKGT